MISIIVCTYNREEYIEKCLESVLNQSANSSLYELVMVNNNSTDSTDDKISAFIRDHGDQIQYSYHTEMNQGLSYARNRGIKESKGDYLVFIDDDAFLSYDYVSHLQSYLDDYGINTFGFGGKIKPYLESALPNWMSPFLMPLMSVLDLGDKVVDFKPNKYPIGANMGFPKQTVTDIGGFNVELGRVGKNLMGGEEKDFFFRMKSAGYKLLYLPKVEVHHVVPDSRLKKDFIKKQALGIGQSERVRVKHEGKAAFAKRAFIELYKWMGSIALFFFYLFTFKLAKGVMILKFRWWVSKGFLSS